ncbi:alkaline shock response membrane anchor protein AmaP [Streptomyces sp. NBC_01213]|uniref:hypothetical protein n=1 Tax=Streptomyces sp. NBC_01213 TaxID=2903776 RepID=UPI00352F3C8F|nr:alkaline shock response membrane anchor protein AmaP [Streptomyces sp. NBC_01213]
MAPSHRASGRIALGALGLVLVSAGALVTGTEASIADRLPSWWPDNLPGAVLVSPERLSELRGSAWWTTSVIVLGTLLTAFFALWFIGLYGGGVRSDRVRLTAPGGDLRLRALRDVLTRRTSSVDGVARCRVRIRAKGHHLHIHTRVWIHPHTVPTAVLPSLSAVLTEAGESLRPHAVIGGTRISTTTRRHSRVRRER